MNRREILFRGKRVDNGEWVYGHYCGTVNDGKYGLIGDTKTNGTTGWHVDIDTLSQFTGLTDSKGNKVFEGDIVKGGIYTAYEIKWDSYRAEFNTGAAGLSVSEVIGTIHDTHLTQQS